MAKTVKTERPGHSPKKRETEPGKNVKVVKRRPNPKKLRPITGIARELFTHVLNSIAFERYGDCCAIDDLAEQFGKTPGRLKPAIRKLVEQGYVTVEGEIFQIIYPTVAALRHQDPKLSKADAERILSKVRGQH